MAFVAFVFYSGGSRRRSKVDSHIRQPHSVAGNGIPTIGDSGIRPVSAEEQTIILSEKRRGR